MGLFEMEELVNDVVVEISTDETPRLVRNSVFPREKCLTAIRTVFLPTMLTIY